MASEQHPPNRSDEKEDISKAEIAFLDDVRSTTHHLSILAKLELARGAIFRRNGDRNSLAPVEPRDPLLLFATDMIDDVIRVLEVHREAGELQYPHP